MSSTSPGAPAPVAGGPRHLRIAVRAIEVAWFVGVPLSLLLFFRLPFGETLGVFVLWLAVLMALDRSLPSNGRRR